MGDRAARRAAKRKSDEVLYHRRMTETHRIRAELAELAAELAYLQPVCMGIPPDEADEDHEYWLAFPLRDGYERYKPMHTHPWSMQWTADGQPSDRNKFGDPATDAVVIVKVVCKKKDAVAVIGIVKAWLDDTQQYHYVVLSEETDGYTRATCRVEDQHVRCTPHGHEFQLNETVRFPLVAERKGLGNAKG